MARTWLIDSRNIARKVKNATQFSAFQTREWGREANRECPNCHHLIDNSDHIYRGCRFEIDPSAGTHTQVLLEWPGLPAGVKFDPSDAELIEHLAGKVGLEGSKPHLFIDEFIPTLQEDKGICYTHPENLPGVKKDGNSVHFFHRTINAYATGHRKRRKIQGQSSMSEEHVRWHKTGRTKPVMENGVQRGFKKIMVLYKSSQKGTKPDKSNWVMHQYHLGTKEDEGEGEYVLSKVFYQQQPKQIEKREVSPSNEEPDISTARVSPRTPKTSTPYPPRSGKRALFDEVDEEKHQNMPRQDPLFISETTQLLSAIHHEENPAWLAGESQAVEDPDPNNLDDSLLCHEILDSYPPFEESGLKHLPYFSDYGHSRNVAVERDINPAGGISELDNIDLDTPPDFQLADLQFGSQESILGWLDRL